MSTGDITIPPIEEGDVLDADSLNSAFESMESGVNGLDQESIAPGALNWPHLSRNKANSSYVIDSASANRVDVLPLDEGETVTFPTTSLGLYSPSSAIFQRSHVDNAPTVDVATFPQPVEIFSRKEQQYAGGILLLCDVTVRKITDSDPPVERADHQSIIWLAAYIAVNGGSFNWVSLPMTERFIDGADGEDGSDGGAMDHSETGVEVSIRHLLTTNSIPWERGAAPSGYRTSGSTTLNPIESIKVSKIGIRCSRVGSDGTSHPWMRIWFGNSRLTCLALRGVRQVGINTSDAWVGYDGSDIGTV